MSEILGSDLFLFRVLGFLHSVFIFFTPLVVFLKMIVYTMYFNYLTFFQQDTVILKDTVKLLVPRGEFNTKYHLSFTTDN